MKCPFCENTEMLVTNSRETFKGRATWRRKKCTHCLETFTTYEEINLKYIVVKKKDDTKERYSHHKLYSSIFNAFAKVKNTDTGDSAEKAKSCTHEVEDIMIQKKTKDISTNEIFNYTLSVLLKKDLRVAMNYFSYFCKDENKNDVEKFLQKFLSKPSH